MKLEHANLSVQDPETHTVFLQAAFPDFRVRGQGSDRQGRPWRHVGNDEFYIALQEVPPGEVRTPYGGTAGMNHLGWEVASVDEIEARMNAAGYEANMRDDSHPARRRLYFYDPDGNDWEFVEYRSEDPAQRNDYSDAG